MSHRAFFVTVWVCSLAGAAGADQFALQRIVADRSIACLPDDLKPVFEQSMEAFRDAALEPGHQWLRDRKHRDANRWHDGALDLSAAAPTATARIEACRSFPRDRTAARLLYRQHGIRKGGELPWAIAEQYDLLVKAFRSKDHQRIIEAAGHLTHFVADAANPFRVSADGDGTHTGNLIVGSSRGVHPRANYRNIRQRFETGIITRFKSQFTTAVDVGPADY